MCHHNLLRQQGIGPSLTCRVGICWIRPYGNPCNFLVSEGIRGVVTRLTLRVLMLWDRFLILQVPSIRFIGMLLRLQISKLIPNLKNATS